VRVLVLVLVRVRVLVLVRVRVLGDSHWLGAASTSQTLAVAHLPTSWPLFAA
jgi:hypothetical protein